MYLTTSDLLTEVEENAFLPLSQLTFTDAGILRIATQQLRGVFVPALKQAKLSFFAYRQDFDVDSDTLTFTVPHRSIGASISHVDLVRSSDGQLMPCSLSYDGGWETQSRGGAHSGEPIVYVSNDKLYLNTTFSGYNTLRMTYYVRPNALVETTACRQVVSANTSQIVIASALSSVPQDTPFDVVGQASPHVFKCMSKEATNVSTVTYTVSLDASEVPAAGDWLCPEGDSCVVQLPDDMFPALVYQTVATMLALASFEKAAAAAAAEASKLLSSVVGMAAPRADRQNQVIAGDSPFAGGGRVRRRF